MVLFQLVVGGIELLLQLLVLLLQLVVGVGFLFQLVVIGLVHLGRAFLDRHLRRLSHHRGAASECAEHKEYLFHFLFFDGIIY